LTLTSRIITLIVDGSAETCLKLMFAEGWQIFSAPVTPDSADMKFLFQPLIDNSTLVKIQDEEGNAVEDWGFLGGWKNFIGDISPGEGYKLRVNSKDSLEVCGAIVDYPYAIPLKAGWNMIGFPQKTAVDALDVVQSLIDNENLEKVQDEEGNAIEDWGFLGGWKNFIGDFIPGKGYKVKLSTADTVLIQEVYEKSVTILPKPVPTSHFNPSFFGNGVDHMNINIAQLPKDFFQPGDELAVFDRELCVGAVTLMPHHFNEQVVSFAASAEDQYGMPGFKEGNSITLKLWSSLQNKEIELNPEILKGTSTFVKHESSLLSLKNYATTNTDNNITLNQSEIKCFPNPFNKEITIEFTLRKEAEVEVNIFNHIGQRVTALLQNKKLNNGVHRLTWDGTTSNQQKAISGMYYVRINIDGVIHHRKIVLNK
ncbi:MAG: T9SS type A sorting domain-containing protein, partial [Bacteroidales bacterium]|nr:T9SS type A sorting domain-containing protein [Bacteroidales bacterium]